MRVVGKSNEGEEKGRELKREVGKRRKSSKKL